MKIPRVYVKGGRYYYVEDLEERNERGRPKQQWHKLTRVEDGEKALLDALAELKGRMVLGVEGGNIRAAIREFMSQKKLELHSDDVRKEYERMFEVVADAFQDFDVDQVGPSDILDFLKRFAGKPTARRAYKARLSTFFSWCVVTDRCAVNPCREIKLKAPPKRKLRIKSEEMFWKIHDCLPPMGQCFLLLCFLTTARPTEIRLLKESQIDDIIHFQPTKTEYTSGATVDWPVTPEIREVLDRARSLNRLRAMAGGDAYVIQERGGSPYTKNGLHTMWVKGVRKAGYSGVTTRDIRPYALTMAEKQGYALSDLRKAAAHTTVTTTEGYLDQYRNVVSPVRMMLPAKGKT